MHVKKRLIRMLIFRLLSPTTSTARKQARRGSKPLASPRLTLHVYKARVVRSTYRFAGHRTALTAVNVGLNTTFATDSNAHIIADFAVMLRLDRLVAAVCVVSYDPPALSSQSSSQMLEEHFVAMAVGHLIIIHRRASGLWPLSLATILGRLPPASTTIDETPHAPPQQQDLDLSLPISSPPDGTGLREASATFDAAIKASHNLPSSKAFSRAGDLLV